MQFQEHAINIGGSNVPHVPIVAQRAIDPGQFSTGMIETNSIHLQLIPNFSINSLHVGLWRVGNNNAD